MDITEIYAEIRRLEAERGERWLADRLIRWTTDLHRRRAAFLPGEELDDLYGRLFRLLMNLRDTEPRTVQQAEPDPVEEQRSSGRQRIEPTASSTAPPQESGLAEPNTQKPPHEMPHRERPDHEEPSTGNPEIAKPQAAEQHAAEPGVVEQGVVEQGVVEPGVVERGVAGPDAPWPDAPWPGGAGSVSAGADADERGVGGLDAERPGQGRNAHAFDAADGPRPVSPPPAPEDVLHARLRELWDRQRDRPRVEPYIAAFEQIGTPGDPIGLWTWLHLLRLRLPEAEARELSDAAWSAVRETAERFGSEGADITPKDLDRFLVPPIAFLEYEGREWQVPPSPLQDPSAALFAKTATRMYQLTEIDPAVRCGYYQVDAGKDRLSEFDDRRRRSYRATLQRCLDRLSGGHPDPLLALIDVDEAARGIVPVPLPAEGSWWEQTLSELRTVLSNLKATLPEIRSSYTPDQASGSQDVKLSQQDVAPLRAAKGQIAWILRAGTPQRQKTFMGRRSSSDDNITPRVAYVDR